VILLVVLALQPMDRPLLHCGVAKASTGRNNTIINKLDFTDVRG
jgi:hypothetical protein